MTRRWMMTGAQEIRLPDGRCLAPGSGEFEADLGHMEDFFVRIGAVAHAEVQGDPAAGDPPSEEGRRPRRQRE